VADVRAHQRRHPPHDHRDGVSRQSRSMLWSASRGVPGSSGDSSGTRSWPTSAHDSTTGELRPELLFSLVPKGQLHVSVAAASAASKRAADFLATQIGVPNDAALPYTN
jgi:hypothetical protein